jgi:starch synthase
MDSAVAGEQLDTGRIDAAAPRDTPRPNCAIQYVPEAYDASQRGVVGRQSAGAGFLDALVRHGGLDRLYCLTDAEQDFLHFQQRVAAIGGEIPPQSWVRPFDADALEQAGCVFLPGPVIAEGAWMRRFVGERRFSVCGITHSVATERVIRSIRDFMVAPTQPWDALICTSKTARAAISHIFESWEAYLESRGFTVGKLPVALPIIPLGVHLDRFTRTYSTQARGRKLRERLGVEPKDVVVLHFGRLDFRSKSHPTPLFRALDLASRLYRRSRLHLLVVGQFSDPVNANEFEAARRLFCPSVPVHWIDGAAADVAGDAWFAADIFVSLPDNVQESFGLTAVEAMAASLPCVVSDWNGLKETVVDGETGIRVPTMMAPAGSGIELADQHARHAFDHFTLIAFAAQCTAVDIDACARAIATLAADPDLRHRMGQAGRARAEAVYDWRGIISQYQALWAELSALRCSAPAVGGRDPARQTVHPDYPDLFAMFAGDPTRSMSDLEQVTLADPDARHNLSRIRLLLMNSFAAPVLLPPERIDDWIGDLEAGPRCVADLLERQGSADRMTAMRSLMWLYKFGIVSIGGVLL